MKSIHPALVSPCVALFALTLLPAAASGRAFYGDPPDATHPWAVHDRNRPQPPVVTPGEAGAPPSDAIVLFDGSNLDAWEATKDGGGGPAEWKVEEGYTEVTKDGGSIRTKEKFGDCQLHLEWAAPAEVKGSGQGRGNSGVFLPGGTEVQILDSYNNETYADGMAGAIYGIHPPLVNAVRPPGEFNAYDIVYRRPIVREDGTEVDPGRVTVFCNGVLIQDCAVLEGPGGHRKRSQPKRFPERAQISLQQHGNPVRFKNIWVRELPPRISEGGTQGGRLSEEKTAELRTETASLILDKAAAETEELSRILLLLESLTYEADPAVEARAAEMLAGRVDALAVREGAALEEARGEVMELMRVLKYLEEHNVFQAPAHKDVLGRLIEEKGWNE